jgi:hypothetical protein
MKFSLVLSCCHDFFQTHLALYCFANSQVSTALKLLYRARYLALLVCGENHPEIALLDVSLKLKIMSLM